MVAHGGQDTIFALASGQGKAAVAVVRLSGPKTRFVVETMAGPLPPARRMSRRTLRGKMGHALDDALVVYFPGPASFTGEDSAEFHLHGGRAVVGRVLAQLGKTSGCRMAEAGEFTRRAFLNGKLDLTRVEALADLVDAETADQAKQALQQLGGALAETVSQLRADLIDVMVLIEADLDFSDEGDVEGDALPVRELLELVCGRLDGLISESIRGERMRDGVTAVILGEPNAGKSTLLNRLALREVAIVTSIPGTTRDLIEVHLDLDGLPLTLVDTAGLRETTDPVEAEGVRRALDRAARADLVIWLRPLHPAKPPQTDGARLISVAAQIDSTPERLYEPGDIRLSALTGEGMDDLIRRMRSEAQDLVGEEPAIVTRERHRVALTSARDSIESALIGLAEGRYRELIAEDVRLAIRALERILGRVDVEDVLDRLFAGFCIGK